MISKYRFTFLLNNISILQKVANFFAFPFFYLARKLNSRNDGASIVIISLNRLGDTVFTIPAIKKIIKNHSENIHVVCYKESEIIYRELLPDLNYITLSHNDFILKGRKAKRKTRNQVKELNPKRIYDLTRSVKSAFLIFDSSSKEIIGSNLEHFKAIYTNFLSIRNIPHLIDSYLEIVNTKFPADNDYNLKEFKVHLSQNGKILIHPFGGWAAKEWGIDNYISLAGNLNKNYDIVICIPQNTLGKSEKDSIINKNIEIIETESIKELIDKIKTCSVFIGNDSGPLYIASMFGKPTFTIYGPTNPDFSVPFGDHHEFIFKAIHCSPGKNRQYCYTHAGMVGCPAFKCMELLQTEEVYNKLIPFLEKYCEKKVNIS